ncbi:hypothetical protein [Kitasatospora sp. NPDC056531]|uniref:hypothetical protein n=1 Tax=Kitasatospora sp. NPDC056531 TaxID=3345856 RepID=UPI0036D12958
MRAGQIGTRIDPSLPPGRRQLAKALVAVYGRLGTSTLAEATELLASHGYKKHASEISRYLNGVHVPPRGFVERLYDVAAERASNTRFRLAKQELLALHASAESTLCKACPKVGRENDDLRSAMAGLKQTNGELLERIDFLQLKGDQHQAENLELRDRVEQLDEERAGLEAALAATRDRSAPLPVPSLAGDRQRSASDVLAAQQLVRQAEEVHRLGEDSAVLSLLGEASQVLTPLESAAALVLLRQQRRNQLAETLLGIYGRDQPEKHVIRAALELHDYGMAADAGALLRASVR